MPLVHAGVVGLRGQLMTILPRETRMPALPLPGAPDDDEIASCQQARASSVRSPAMIGVLEAREAAQILARRG